jgi:hypothetical protein
VCRKFRADFDLLRQVSSGGTEYLLSNRVCLELARRPNVPVSDGSDYLSSGLRLGSVDELIDCL